MILQKENEKNSTQEWKVVRGEKEETKKVLKKKQDYFCLCNKENTSLKQIGGESNTGYRHFHKEFQLHFPY